MTRARALLVVMAVIAVTVCEPGAAMANDPLPSPSSPPDSLDPPPGGEVLSPDMEALLAGDRIVAMPYGATGYRFKQVPYGAVAGFQAVGFDDAAAGFGDGQAAFASDTCGGPRNTPWTGETDMLLRRTISLPPGTQDVRVSVAIDNDIQLFWNGTDVSGGLVVSEGCGIKDEYTFNVPAAAVQAGQNLLAARARNRHVGSSHVDLQVTVEAFPPANCADENLYARLGPLTDGRVTAVYDGRYLVDPGASAASLADAERIARHIQARAEAALDRYDILLGSSEATSHTPPDVTVEIRCQPRLEILDEIPILHIDRPGFTGDWDDVQLRSDDVRAGFAPAVIDSRAANGDFLPGSWDSPPAVWASGIDHEIFHTVQHWGQSDMGWDYLVRPDAGNLEAGATLAQDLFADADDDVVPERGSYWRAVQNYFSAPVPITVEVATDENAYTSAPLLQYLGEQYGGLAEVDRETRVANFLRRMIVSDEEQIEQLQDAMLSGDGVNEAIRDFTIAAYVNDKPTWANYPARYQIFDEVHDHAASGPGTDYPAFQGITGPSDDNDLTLGGTVSLDEPLGAGEGRIFEIDIAPNVLLARLSVHAWTAEGEAPAAVAIMPVNSDGSIEITPAYMPHGLVRAEYQEPITIPVAGISRFAVVVASTARTAGGSGQVVHELVVADVSNLPSISIVAPSDQATSIGPAGDFGPIQVHVRPLRNQDQIRGLSAAAFDVEIGGFPAEIRSASRIKPDGRYVLVVQPPATLAPGSHDLKVTLANVTFDTAPGTILVDQGPSGLAVQSSGAGAVGFLHLDSLGEAGTPLQVRYLLADPAAAILGASVSAIVTDPTGAQRSASLVDDGGHNDGAVADGIYGAALWMTDAPGVHTVVATASGNDSTGMPFSLQATEAASVVVKTDADGDGVADLIEPWYQLDPADGTDASADADGDGLTVGQELAGRTDPYSADTDGGGEADGSELTAGRNPNDLADDGDAPRPTLSANVENGSMISVRLATEDGAGLIRLNRRAGGADTLLGTYAGAASVVADGPLATGDYFYVAVGIGSSGAASAPVMVGPITPVADASPPDGSLVVNGGQWHTTDPEVTVEFADVSEPVTQMRLALNRDDLEQAAWVPYQASSTLSVPPEFGLYVIHAELRDAAGNSSRVLTGVAQRADATPPSSTAGPLAATYSIATVDVPFTASDDFSGVSSVELWWRHRPTSASAWTVWSIGPTGSASPITFAFSSGYGTYEFFTVALDGVGNREPAPSTADASTTVPDTLRAWGRNEAGQLGRSTSETCYAYACASTPIGVQVAGTPVVADGGFNHSLLLTSAGTVWSWGGNGSGQLGDGTTAPRTTPAAIAGLAGVGAISAGHTHSLALLSGGTVRAWGSNSFGQIGDGSTITRPAPVAVSGLSGVTAIASGSHHNLALLSNGTVRAWGMGTSGQLGDNGTKNRLAPVAVSGLTNVVALAAGGNHSLALKADGTVWAWGLNADGQLGVGNTTNRKTPVRITTLAGVSRLAAGEFHSFAVGSDGKLRAWGRNSQGQLGDGTTVKKTAPVLINALTGIVSLGGGSAFSLATTSDGQVWTWGHGGFGQLGTGSLSDRLTPGTGTGVPDATTLGTGLYHAIVLVDQ